MTGTDLETRLSAALQARADLVTPESLPPLAVPEPRVVPFVRRPATWAVAAAASAVLIALPFVFANSGNPSDMQPAPAPTPTETTTPAALSGDVDGDGYDETVTIDGHGVISVVLFSSSSGTPLTVDAGADGSALVGLAWLGDSPAVVADDHGTGRVFRVTADGLVQVEVEGGQSDYPFTENDPERTWFVEGGQLFTAVPGEETIRYAAAWELNAQGRLVDRPVGEYCYDSAAGHPKPCGGRDGVVSGDPPRQIALFPEAEPLAPGQTFHGGVYEGDAIVSLDGTVVSIRIGDNPPYTFDLGPGTGYRLYPVTLSSNSDATAVVVSQTDGAQTTYRVVGWQAGELVEYLPPNLGGGGLVPPDPITMADQVTWVSVTGRLFTRYPDPDEIAGEHVVRWSLDQAPGLTAEPVEPQDPGTLVCFDTSNNPPTYNGC